MAFIKERIASLVRDRGGQGTHAGGSGSLSEVDIYVEEVRETGREGSNILFECVYEKVVTTEFTIYPDNPPYVSRHRVVFSVSEEGEIVEVGE